MVFYRSKEEGLLWVNLRTPQQAVGKGHTNGQVTRSNDRANNVYLYEQSHT